MYGFGNALAFSLVNDADITDVENLIKSRTLTILTANSNDTDGLEQDNSLSKEIQMKEYFGDMYYKDSKNFEFLPGDKKLIKYLVNHIKIVVASKGIKKGLKHFKSTQKSNRIQVAPANANILKPITEYDDAEMLSELKTSLFQKVIECLELFNVNEIMELENISDNIVSVSMHNGQIFGDVYCILCSNEKKKSRPKRVSYSSKYWIPSNFVTHLKKVHKLSQNKFKSNSKNADIQQVDTFNDDDVIKTENIDLEHIKTEDITFHDKNENIEVEIVEYDELNGADGNNENEEIIIVDGLNRNRELDFVQVMYNQMSNQIINMSKKIFFNEVQTSMDIKLGSEVKSIQVVSAPDDGNCLFTSLVHQLTDHKMISDDMKIARDQLRAEVVKYIQENRDLFKFEINGRVYENLERQNRDCSTANMEMECDLFVYQLLPLNKYWGGSETLKAVAMVKEVNIIIFNENGPCCIKNPYGKKFKKTICVAFRLASNNPMHERIAIRNHYDSVTDIPSNVIYSIAQSL